MEGLLLNHNRSANFQSGSTGDARLRVDQNHHGTPQASVGTSSMSAELFSRHTPQFWSIGTYQGRPAPGCERIFEFADAYAAELKAKIAATQQEVVAAHKAYLGKCDDLTKAERERDQAREALRNIRLVARTCPDIVIARTIEEIADDALAAVPPSEDAPPQIGNMNIGLHEALQRGEFTVGAAGSDLLGEDAPATPQPVKECPNCGSKNPYFYGRNCIKNAVSWHRDNQKPAEPAAQPAGKEAPTKGALKAARAINQGLPVSILDQGVIKKFGVSEAAAEYEYRIAQIIDREMRPESLLKKEGLE